MAEETSSKLEIAMFPWFAFGHFIPYMQLSNKFAEKGHQISFLLPTKASNQLNHLNLHPNLIKFHQLTVPQVEGLPPGTETVSYVPVHRHNLLALAMDLMRDQVKELLKKLNPDVVFYDFAYWIPELASEIGFKTVSFNVVSAAAIAYMIVPPRHVSKDRPFTDEELMHPPPGYPSSVLTRNKREAKELHTVLNREFGKGITFYDRIKTSLMKSDVISMRTCRELEGPFCDYLSSEYNKPVLLTGPLLPEPGKQSLENRWVKWLDAFEPGTVVFCAFGSQSYLEKDQFQELVLGFELTGKPFFVVLKPPVGAATVEEALPEGFENRTRGKGIVFEGWLQGLPYVLSHPSVGCFVNHCGFGSMWESLMSDTQIVLIPQLRDQKLITRLLVAEFKVAVEVEVEEDKNGWISKENLCRAINRVMDQDSEIRWLVKDNHTKLREIIGKPSFTSDYAERFIQNLGALCGPFAPDTKGYYTSPTYP
uniref:Anthocyanidin 3-O-glucoside 2'''-O-xylosyltransferase n=1 Tax=Gymnema sylvestre TaxID=4068 RepID=A0AA49C3C2_GYMSY|nr:anthocyanidin 3-O-glucoside 2'''-O-xylosyltransferase [Gymnema sylvestre]